MRTRFGWTVCLLVCLAVVALAACEPAEDDPASAPTAPDQGNTGNAANPGAAVVPTWTVEPIVSYTPKYTATPIPSLTPTPTISPVPPTATLTETPTQTYTPTVTPTVSGELQSASQRGINLRSEPGLDQDIVVNVDVGAEVGVLDMQPHDDGYDWYQVSYFDGEDEYIGWVRGDLILTDFDPALVQAVPTQAPENTPVEGTPAPVNTVGPGDPTLTPMPTPGAEAKTVLADCDTALSRTIRERTPPEIGPDDEVYIWWSWWVTQSGLMADHLEHARYVVTLDGEPLEDWEQYGSGLIWNPGQSVWFMYWYVPVGTLAPGEHNITYEVTWDERVYDGISYYGPESDNLSEEGTCTFTVSEAES